MVRVRFLLLLAVIVVGLGPGSASSADLLPLQAVPQTDQRWGINHIFGQPRLQALARDAGATWNRWEFRWADIETQRGRFQFGTYDSMVTASRNHGFEVHGILISTPTWAADPRTGLPSGLHLSWNDPNNSWGRFVRQIAGHYRGQVRNWEIWNEPDYAEIFWSGTTADYYQLLKVAYLSVKSVDPNARVLLGGLAYWPNPGFLPELLQLMMTDPIARENNHFFDVLVWHTYSRPVDSYERLIESRQLLAATVGPRPIWINETNVPAWDESPIQNYRPYSWAATVGEQASYIIQALAYGVAGGAERIGVYRLQDTEWPEAFGLLRTDGTVRPAYVAFQVATQALSSSSSAHLLRHGDVEHVVARRPGERVSVVWNRSAERLATRLGAVAPSATLLDQTGARVNIKTTAGQFRVELPPATAHNGGADYFIGGAPYLVLEALPANLTTTSEAGPALAYSGPWETVRTSAATDGAASRSTVAGQGVAVEFAEQLTWVTAHGPDRGIARVEVDGILQGEIDLYEPQDRWDVPYTFGDFGPGGHRATITATGRRNAAALGAFIDVDAVAGVGLQGTPPPPEPAPVASNVSASQPPFSHAEATAYRAVEPASGLVALPLVYRSRDGWSTRLTVQQSGAATSPVTIRYRAESGAEVTSQQLPLGSFGSTEVDVRTVPGLGDGFAGAATVESTEPIAVTATHVRDGSDAFAYAGLAVASDRAFAPLLFKNTAGWHSSLALQNLNTTAAGATVRFRGARGEEIGQTTVVLPPMGVASLPLATVTALPQAFTGSAMIEAPGGRVAAVVMHRHDNGSVAGYDAIPRGSATLAAPLLHRGADGWNSGLQVQNVGAGVTTARVVYTAAGGGSRVWSDSTLVLPGGTATWYLPAHAELPEGFVGSAVVTSSNNQPLVAVVHTVATERAAALSYPAAAAGAGMLALPVVQRSAAGWSTGVQVQNLGSDQTMIVLLIQDERGVLVRRELAALAPGAAHPVQVAALGGLPAGWRGSATLRSIPEQPLGAVVTATRYEPGRS